MFVAKPSVLSVFLSLPVLGFVVALSSMSYVGGCSTPQQAKDAKQVSDTALDAIQLACLMNGLGGFVVDAEAASKICNIAPKLLPVISDLIGVRDAARRSGAVIWRSGDAGPPDAAVR